MTRVARVVVRARRVRARGDDGEVHLVVALGQEPAEISADTSASVRPTSAISPACSCGRHAVGGRAGRAQRLDLGGVLPHPRAAP